MSRSNGLRSSRPCRNIPPAPDGCTAIPHYRQRGLRADNPVNQHRGSDFNQFLAQENLMTPTPRTDAIAHRGLGSVAYIAEMTDFAREIEAELAAERALADRLADALENSVSWDYAKPAFDAWKEARRGIV